jgi:predicted outer membrane repeat protein
MKKRKEKRQNSTGRLEAWKKWAGPRRIALSLVFLCAAGCGGSDEPQGPQTRTVSKRGDGDFGSIQECISASNNRDTCLVYPGTYRERIRFQGKAITVRSLQGPERTIIDGREQGTVVTFSDFEDDDSVLDGFTITNGSAVVGQGTLEHGGGIEIISAAPVIQNCIVLNNKAEGDGGGIYSFSTGSKPEIRNVVFQGNTAEGQGGGLCAVYGAPVLINCLFLDNQADVGGAINGRFCTKLVLTNCTIADNSAREQAGALYLKNTTAETTNSIYWNNPSPGDPPIVIDLDDDLEGEMKLSLDHVDLQGSDPQIDNSIQRSGDCLNILDPCKVEVVGGMLDKDPLFVPLLLEEPLESPWEAFYLSEPDTLPPRSDQIAKGRSPCVDTGTGSAEDAGLEETTTRTDGVADTGPVDLGYHYPATM